MKVQEEHPAERHYEISQLPSRNLTKSPIATQQSGIHRHACTHTRVRTTTCFRFIILSHPRVKGEMTTVSVRN